MQSNIEKIIEVNNLLVGVVDNALSVLHGAKKSISLADRILMYLINRQACVTPSDIISEFDIKKSNLTTLCNNLIDLKLIEKCKSTVDGRAISYLATKQGVEYIQNITSKVDDKIAKYLSADETQKLAANLDEIILLLK